MTSQFCAASDSASNVRDSEHTTRQMTMCSHRVPCSPFVRHLCRQNPLHRTVLPSPSDPYRSDPSGRKPDLGHRSRRSAEEAAPAASATSSQLSSVPLTSFWTPQCTCTGAYNDQSIHFITCPTKVIYLCHRSFFCPSLCQREGLLRPLTTRNKLPMTFHDSFILVTKNNRWYFRRQLGNPQSINQSINQSIEEFVTRTMVDGSSRIWGVGSCRAAEVVIRCGWLER